MFHKISSVGEEQHFEGRYPVMVLAGKSIIMKYARRIAAVLAIVYFWLPVPTNAASVTAQGSVLALDNVDQLTGILGVDDFDSRRDPGITFHDGVSLDSILPGISVPVPLPPILGGDAFSLIRGRDHVVGTDGTPKPIFPGPLTGGGVHENNFLFHGVASFSQPVAQIGLTAGKTDIMFLTAFDHSGSIIGQVTWETGCNGEPDCLEPAGFVGIDTQGVLIALAIWGNDDLFAGDVFQIAGITPFSDTWIWASGEPTVVPLPAALPLFGTGLGIMGFIGWRRKRRMAAEAAA